jgi:MoxR-like ATPase
MPDQSTNSSINIFSLNAGETTPETTTEDNTGSIDFERVNSLLSILDRYYAHRVVGQESLKTVLMVALLVKGHVLLESLPGLAKTTAAKALADSIHATFKRIQCTPDLLPSDIIGTQIYNQQTHSFETKKGPVHANFVLLDEINRSSAKTQSAMLEAMQERQTTIGGEIYPLPSPFMVIATQNPVEQEGTYRLPEAQLDRFLLKETITYPTPFEEREVLKKVENGDLTDTTTGTTSLDDLIWLQEQVKRITLSEPIYEYIINIVYATRHIETILGEERADYVKYGASPRASIAFLESAKAYALLNGRNYVIPEDIKVLSYPILRHRIITTYEAEEEGYTSEKIIDEILKLVKTP